jgi:hypothetical protein
VSGSHSTNDAAVQFEEQQAAEADQKEKLREQRLQQGTASINAIFEGQPVMKDVTSNYDWGKFNPSTLSMQNTWRSANNQAASNVDVTDPTQYGLPSNYKIVGQPGGGYAVQDPSGKT